MALALSQHAILSILTVHDRSRHFHAYPLVAYPVLIPISSTLTAVPVLLQIVLRKGYHIIAAVLFMPAFFWDLPMLAVSLAIAFAALVAMEILRCARVPVVGAAVQRFMQVRDSLGGRAVEPCSRECRIVPCMLDAQLRNALIRWMRIVPVKPP